LLRAEQGDGLGEREDKGAGFGVGVPKHTGECMISAVDIGRGLFDGISKKGRGEIGDKQAVFATMGIGRIFVGAVEIV
jgi:hypothetical protein